MRLYLAHFGLESGMVFEKTMGQLSFHNEFQMNKKESESFLLAF